MAKAKRGATELFGVLAVDKAAGVTSHDVIAKLRRLTGEGRIGHAGTLDPMATGLLLVCVGSASRLSSHIMAAEKTYEARVIFGASTDTDDAEGSVLERAELPAGLADTTFAASILDGFIGEQEQLPPRFSAIKKDGKKAYELARAGIDPKLEPRRVSILGIELLNAEQDFWDIRVRVSKGTYIRSLARDIGLRAGTKAHLGALRRTHSGPVAVTQAHSLGSIEELSAHAPSQADFLAEFKTLFLNPIKDLALDPNIIPKSLKERILEGR